MWIEIILSIALYVVPLAALPFIVRREPVARRVAILALLVAPLVGAIVYLLHNQKFSIGGLVFVYPFALFPLGLWAALIGALTTPLMFYLNSRYGQLTLVFVAPISGAVIGAVFMFIFVHGATWIQQPNQPIDLSFYLACGVTAGVVIGLLAAWVVGRLPDHAIAVT